MFADSINKNDSELFHLYDFRGEKRTYRKKLTLIDESIVRYLGTTTKFVDHWNKPEKKYYPESNVLPPNYTVEQFLEDTKHYSQSSFPDKLLIIGNKNKEPKSKSSLPMTTNEYFVYSVRGEKQYYKIYKEWDADVVKQYDIKFLGIAALPGKAINDYQSNGQKNKTTTRVKRNKIPAIDRPDEKHCVYCGIELTARSTLLPTASTIEHIKPLIRGGTDDKSNLRNACLECNNEKGGLMLHSYIQLLNLKLLEVTGPELVKLQTKISNANKIAKELEND
jgi:hypothetical protein